MTLDDWREKYQKGDVYCVPRGFSYVQIYGLKKPEDEQAITDLYHLEDCYKTFKGVSEDCYFVKPREFIPFRDVLWSFQDLAKWFRNKFSWLGRKR